MVSDALALVCTRGGKSHEFCQHVLFVRFVVLVAFGMGGGHGGGDALASACDD